MEHNEIEAALRLRISDLEREADGLRLFAQTKMQALFQEAALHAISNSLAAKLQLENAHLRLEVERLRIAGGESEPRFVLLSDYQHLKAEVERLRASSFVTAVPVEQYERVVKAGDAMASSIQFNEEMAKDYNGPTVIHQCVKAWNAAKEGRPNE